MVQEATMLVVDDSDFMRNGDYIPSRMEAQSEAVMLVCQSRRQAHPENTVGLLTLSKPELLSTLCTDINKINAKLHAVQPKGDTKASAAAGNRAVGDLGNINFVTAVRVAHLALRHRLSKNQKMRIVVFVGSAIKEEVKELENLGKRLKKEKVNIDIVNFGEMDANMDKLTALIEAANGGPSGGGGSHLVSVPPGGSLRESLISSPIIIGEDGRGAVPLSGGGMDFLDPNEDPELLLALRVSMEDQRMRLEQNRQQQQQGGATGATDSAQGTAGNVITQEEQMLQQALASLSRGGGLPEAGGHIPMGEMDFSAMTEDEQIALALQMSLQPDLMGTPEVPNEESAAQQAEREDTEEAMETDQHPTDPQSPKKSEEQ